MDLEGIVSALKNEMERIERAISALLEGSGVTAAPVRSAGKVGRPKRKGITPAGRRRIAEAMRARWAARRKSPAISGAPTMVAAATPKKRGGLTAAGRKRLSEAMKRRWAERRKAASK